MAASFPPSEAWYEGIRVQPNQPVALPSRRAVTLILALLTVLSLLSATRPLAAPAAADNDSPANGQFTPLWNNKLLDTSTGFGTWSGDAGKVPANGTLTFPISGRAGIADWGVSAVSLTIKVVTPATNGFLAIHPSDDSDNVPTVAFTGGETTTGADFTRVTPTGQLTVANHSGSAVHVFISTDGYFQNGDRESDQTIYEPLETKVLWDSRNSTGLPAQTTPIPAWSSIDVQVAGRAGVPEECDQAGAVALNVVAIQQTADGLIKINPSDAPLSEAAVAYTQNDYNNSAFTISQLSCTGKLKITNESGGTVHVSLSVRGYFTWYDGDQTGANFKPGTPATVLNTATGVGTGGSTTQLAPNASIIVNVSGASGVPVNTVAAAALQINVPSTPQGGWISLRPEDEPDPNISSMHYQANEAATGFDTVIPSGLGRVSITNHSSGGVHLNITTRGFYIFNRVQVIETDGPEQENLSYQNANAAEAADLRAGADPSLGPSSYDPVTNTVITTATTPAGLTAAAQPLQVPAAPATNEGVGDGTIVGDGLPEDTEVDDAPDDTDPPAGPTVTVTPRAVLAPNSATSLQAVRDEVTDPAAPALPDAASIQAVYVQEEDNRVVVETTNASAALQAALTTRYGPSKVALKVVEDAEWEDAACTLGRRSCLDGNQSPSRRQFAGGAGIRNIYAETGKISCTSGFKYKVGSNKYLLTAGHCGEKGDLFETLAPNSTLGTLTGSNWGAAGSLPKNPTCCPPWNARFSGDLALIKIRAGGYTRAVIYKDDSTIYKVIGDAEDYRPRRGDRVCVSGAKTNKEFCGFKVTETSADVPYPGNRLVRGAAVARRGNVAQAECPVKGDSGGPVYTVVSGTTVWARGILSGRGYKNGTCEIVFTPIAEARWVSGGNVVHAN